MTDEQLEYALDLMRRMPPNEIEDNLAWLIDLVPDLTEDLLSAVDQPLQIAKDEEAGRDYLLCDYNRDGDSYRSPWSNEYDPKLPDGAVPSDELRTIEIALNEVFDVYREMYYEGGVSSVYCWDLEGAFAACVLIKKGAGKKGVWDSIHVIEVENQGKGAIYKLTTTIMLSCGSENPSIGELTLCGLLTRQSQREVQDINTEHSHVVNIGELVEDMEIKMRKHLEVIYFGKMKNIVASVRSATSLADLKKMEELQSSIFMALKEKNAQRAAKAAEK